MIVKPSEMNFEKENIIMIASGLPGTGKTTMAFSAPNAIVIDADKGVKRVSIEHRKDTMIIKDYSELLRDIKTPEFERYDTVVFDTTGALIEMIKDWAIETEPSARKKNGGISIQGFGIVKSEFLRLSNELKKTHNVIYVFHTSKGKDREGNSVYELMCEGATREIVWQPADLGAYMQIIGEDRYLCFTPTQEYSAKSGYGIKGMIKVPELKEGDENTFLTKIFEKVKAFRRDESKAQKVLHDKYSKATEQGNKIVDSITNAQTANKAIQELQTLKHGLTSEKELRAKLQKKAKELKLKFNKDTKKYE